MVRSDDVMSNEYYLKDEKAPNKMLRFAWKKIRKGKQLLNVEILGHINNQVLCVPVRLCLGKIRSIMPYTQAYQSPPISKPISAFTDLRGSGLQVSFVMTAVIHFRWVKKCDE